MEAAQQLSYQPTKQRGGTRNIKTNTPVILTKKNLSCSLATTESVEANFWLLCSWWSKDGRFREACQDDRDLDLANPLRVHFIIELTSNMLFLGSLFFSLKCFLKNL